jgi:hypothetical protein
LPLLIFFNVPACPLCNIDFRLLPHSSHPEYTNAALLAKIPTIVLRKYAIISQIFNDSRRSENKVFSR